MYETEIMPLKTFSDLTIIFSLHQRYLRSCHDAIAFRGNLLFYLLVVLLLKTNAT